MFPPENIKIPYKSLIFEADKGTGKRGTEIFSYCISYKPDRVKNLYFLYRSIAPKIDKKENN